MVRDSKTGPSFYKFLMDDDFTSKLRIPTQFVKNYEDYLPSKITLRTHDLSGKSISWRVQIEQIGQHHFFTKGWSKFGQDVDLKLREFLLFQFVGGSAFHVSVYDITGCKKEFSYFGDQERNTSAVKRWGFSKELKIYHFADCRLTIPKCFAKGTGIAKCSKIELQDTKGRKWPVKVSGRKVGKFAMTAGWKNFLTGNKVKLGSTISFEFIPSSGNIIKARVLKSPIRKELQHRGNPVPPLMIKP